MRDEERSSRMFLAALRDAQGASVKITVRNLSRLGVGARASEAVPPLGETVFIELGPFGDVEGVVRWVSGNRFGVALTQPIDPEHFDFSGKDWSVANKQFDTNHVYTQFRPVGDVKRPPLKPRN